jgi:L-amino acid N-acyltransferase YncA
VSDVVTGRPRPTIRGQIRVDQMRAADADAVLRIHGEGIATGNATLDTVVPTWAEWNAAHRPDCRFVARIAGQVVGWAALAPYSARSVYAGVAWESVYVAAAARGQGIGGALLARLLPASERAGIWTLIAGIQVENAASLGLHERAGFRRIGVQQRVGQDGEGRWRDVVLLERRSESVGT